MPINTLRHCAARFVLAAMLTLGAGAAAMARPVKPAEVAGAIAYLLRIRDGACPGITFDPFIMSKMIAPAGLSVEAVRRRFPRDFDSSYAEAGSRIAGENLAAYCSLIRTMFSRTPGEFPGLVFH